MKKCMMGLAPLFLLLPRALTLESVEYRSSESNPLTQISLGPYLWDCLISIAPEERGVPSGAILFA